MDSTEQEPQDSQSASPLQLRTRRAMELYLKYPPGVREQAVRNFLGELTEESPTSSPMDETK